MSSSKSTPNFKSLGEEIWKKTDKIVFNECSNSLINDLLINLKNGELFVLTYGSLVNQILSEEIENNSPNPGEATNVRLDKM